jgi:hypothetical protein
VDGEWRIEEDIWNEDTPPPDTTGQ